VGESTSAVLAVTAAVHDGWTGEDHFERWPTVLYGVNLLCCAIAYYLLQTRIIRCQGRDSLLAKAVGRDLKGKISPVLYMCGIVAAWTTAAEVGVALFVLVALMWLVPDRRPERATARRPHG